MIESKGNDLSELNHKTRINRRQFLAGAAGLTALNIVPRHVLGGSGYIAPSDKVNVAVIGTGGQGMVNLKNLLQLKDVQIPAIADVTEEADYSAFYYQEPGGRMPAYRIIKAHYESRQAQMPQLEVFVDFRRMLDKVKDIDAVLVATPDHTHAIIALDAIKRGKHIYCEKPLARTIAEVRKITEAAKAAGVVSQMGIQGHAGEGLRLAAEWLRDGAIGDVTEIHAWSEGHFFARCDEGYPVETPAVPKGLHWDLWLGPAKFRPYHPLYTPVMWRLFWEYGTGKMSDMGIHHMDPAFYALDLKYPEQVEASATWGDKAKRPHASMVTFKFPARDEKPPVKLTWYSGLRPPCPDELETGRKLTGGGNGILYVGSKGKMMSGGWAGIPRLIPESDMQAYDVPSKTIPRVKGGHHRDFIDAIKQGRKAGADFSYSGPLTETILSGIVAMRMEKRLIWDGPNMKALNCPEADELITPVYENGWVF